MPKKLLCIFLARRVVATIMQVIVIRLSPQGTTSSNVSSLMTHRSNSGDHGVGRRKSCLHLEYMEETLNSSQNLFAAIPVFQQDNHPYAT